MVVGVLVSHFIRLDLGSERLRMCGLQETVFTLEVPKELDAIVA